MPKRFNVVVAREGGGVEVYPMKEWLRQHPEHVPSGLDATTSTSHQLRDALKRKGWQVLDTPTEVRLSLPGADPTAVEITSVLGNAAEAEGESDEDAAFGLEYQLRDFIAQNLTAINVAGRRLRLFVDSTGRDGVEYPTAVGPIDILALDPSGNFVVFELKRARSPDQAIGQLARYMGWVKQTIGKGKEVVGVIVAKEITTNLRYAVSVLPNVMLFEYEVSFRLTPAHELTS